MKMLPLTLSVLIALNSQFTQANAAPPQEYDPFAELDQEMNDFNNEGSKAELNEFQQWKSEYLAQYQAFRVEHFKKVDDIRDNLISQWGESEVSSQQQYVEYSKDNNTRTVVDFENNEIRISVLHDEDKTVTKIAAIKAIKDATNKKESKRSNALVQLLGNKPSETSIKNMVNKADKKDNNIAITQNNTAVIRKEIQVINEQANVQKQYVEIVYDQMVADEEAQSQKVTGSSKEAKIAKDIEKEKSQIEHEKKKRIASLKAKLAQLKKGKKREQLKEKKITTFTIPLKHKNELTKAKPFISDVQIQSKRWDLEPSLMLAIMHTESYFNPKAQSHVPAYGLMQIVPRTAGIDVNRMLFKQDKPMSQHYLFDADQNIEAGVAYMHILNSRYLRKITHPESRMYCMIAAYNTGSGNVAKTFNKDKTRNINKAAPIINAMTPKQVYNHLVNNLPYDETRHYLKRVVTRKDIYAPVQKL